MRVFSVAAVLIAIMVITPTVPKAQPRGPGGPPGMGAPGFGPQSGFGPGMGRPPGGMPMTGPDDNFPMMSPEPDHEDGQRSSDGLDVTTDSAVYCDRLISRLDGYANPPRIVQELRDEGETMCRDGHVHAGIGRLRRALMAAREGGG